MKRSRSYRIAPTHPEDDLPDCFSDIPGDERLAQRTTMHEKHLGLCTLIMS
jgi:hypothetical protein